jgi:hypothetical protein
VVLSIPQGWLKGWLKGWLSSPSMLHLKCTFCHLHLSPSEDLELMPTEDSTWPIQV